MLCDYAAPSKVAISHRQLNSSADLIAFKICPSSRFDHGLVNLRSSAGFVEIVPNKASVNPRHIGAEPRWAYKTFIIFFIIYTSTVSLQILNGPWVWESIANRGKTNLTVSECLSDPTSGTWNAAQGLASKSFTRPKTVETSLELSAVGGKHRSRQEKHICTVYSWGHWEYSIRSCKHTPKYLAVSLPVLHCLGQVQSLQELLDLLQVFEKLLPWHESLTSWQHLAQPVTKVINLIQTSVHSASTKALHSQCLVLFYRNMLIDCLGAERSQATTLTLSQYLASVSRLQSLPAQGMPSLFQWTVEKMCVLDE